ncbi:MAG TPA: ferritin-like domain-containing protein, partial [Burkholderiales bacterium]|nr:ferritin-like domain-containing protein [Burkholderiales bacterium]
RDLSRAAASILGDEAMHWAILRQVLGEDPVPAAFVG